MTINAELLSLKSDIAAALDGGRELNPEAAKFVRDDLEHFKTTLAMAYNLGGRKDGHEFGEQPVSEIIPDQERLMAEVEAKAWRR